MMDARCSRLDGSQQLWPGPIDQTSTKELTEVIRMLAAVEMIDAPEWRRAADGDAAAAIGLALDLRRRPSEPLRSRLVMLALWRCACAGDPAAVATFASLATRRDLEASPLDRGFRP